MRTIFAVPAVFIAAACAQPVAAPQPIQIQSAFDPAEAAFIRSPGPNTIAGQAFLRQKGGGVVTCAGQTVMLIPRTQYSQERVMALYGTISAPALNRTNNVSDPAPGYQDHMRTTTCDAQGNFRFEGVPDGRYFVNTVVSWSVGYRPQGGAVMTPADVAGGGEHQVLIAPG